MYTYMFFCHFSELLNLSSRAHREARRPGAEPKPSLAQGRCSGYARGSSVKCRGPFKGPFKGKHRALLKGK